MDLSTAEHRYFIYGNHDGQSVGYDGWASACRYDIGGSGYGSFDMPTAVPKIHVVILRVDDTTSHYSYLLSSITTATSDIWVTSTNGFDASGYIAIDDLNSSCEMVAYSGVTISGFIGCTRGFYDTTPKSHLGSSVITDTFFKMSQTQINWLEQDLANTLLPTIVFLHQRLDMDYPGTYRDGTHAWAMSNTAYSFITQNAKQIRQVIDRSNKVFLVITGHSHSPHQGIINNISYINLGSFSNSVAYGTLRIYDDYTFDYMPSSHNMEGQGLPAIYRK
jgi:hypothetical protein